MALMYFNDITMRDVVKHLREGWYGNVNKYCDGQSLKKLSVDCRKLWKTCLDIAGTKFVPICDGISGKIGSLVVDETFVDESIDLPIDTLVVDLTRDDEFVDDWGAKENI